MSLSTSYFSTPPTANVNTYIGGIPSSIVSADGGREQLQAYDNIYDTNSAAQQQLTTLQNQVVDLRNQILQLQYAKASQTIPESPNWIVNGDCSQFTLAQPVIGTVNAGINNTSFMLQGRAVPIMDRWYHIFEGAGFNASNVKMEAKQVNLTSYITGTPAFGTYPSSTAKGLSVKWSNPSNSNPCFSLETVNTGRYGGVVGVQHIVPNIREFVSKTYTLGFWIYSSKPAKGFVRVLRQYNTTQKGGPSLDTVLLTSFDTTGGGWKYVTMPIVFPTLTAGKTLTEDQHGCVIQIGPAYYRWDYNVILSLMTTKIYGSPELFTVTTPGVEFVLAEIQLRSDVLSLDGKAFPSNIREEERTLKYVSYVSPQKPQTMNIPGFNGIVMGTGECKFKDMHQVIAHFKLDFASRLVRLPKIIIWSYKNTSAQDNIIRWANTTQAWDVGATRYDMWGPVATQALDVNMVPYILIKEGDPDLFVDLESTMISRDWYGNLKRALTIGSLTESSMIFKATVDYADFGGSASSLYYSRGIPVYTSMVTNRLGEIGWFTCIVAECDTGDYDDQTEVLSYIDFSFSAPTTLPL